MSKKIKKKDKGFDAKKVIHFAPEVDVSIKKIDWNEDQDFFYSVYLGIKHSDLNDKAKAVVRVLFAMEAEERIGD